MRCFLKPCAIDDLPKILKRHFEEFEAVGILGTALLSSGVLVLLHSQRFNRDYPIIVVSHDLDYVTEYIKSTRERFFTK